MDQSSIQEKKKKFTHSTSKAIFCTTFFHNHEIYYIVQCESGEVFVGNFEGNFKLAWKGSIKQKITCVSHCHKHKILYAGTAKGTIVVIHLKKQSSQGDGKIEAVNGQPILAMFAYSNQINQSPEIIAVNSEGILRKYENNKFTVAKQLPFKVTKAISNKTIRDKNDVAMILLKNEGKYPYIFSAEFYIELCKQQTTQENLLAQIEEYDKSMNYQSDEQIDSSNVSAFMLSNSKTILAVAAIEPPIVSIYNIAKQNNKFYLIADFKFETKSTAINMDIVDSSLLYICKESISAYNVESREKQVKGLTIKQTEYNLAFWCELPNIIVYGSTLTNRMKLSMYQLKFPDKKKQD